MDTEYGIFVMSEPANAEHIQSGNDDFDQQLAASPNKNKNDDSEISEISSVLIKF